MTITLNRWKLLFSEFRDFLRQKNGETFESFRTSDFLEQEEAYKYSIVTQARRNLGVEAWTIADLGTGRIRQRVESMLFSEVGHNGRSVRNNLFDWRKRDAFVDLPRTKQFERLFFDFYTDQISDPLAFDRLLKSGVDYRLISYFFFVKDRTRFLPIAQSTFDRFFENKLQIDFRTVRRASWENYETYLGIVSSAHEFLLRVDPEATFLDAHSFIWIIARQREAWLAEHGLKDEELDERHFLQYWLLERVDTVIDSGRELEHGGSNQYEGRGIKPGDVVWIVTLGELGELMLSGRILVDDIVTYDEAVALYPDEEVIEKKRHIIADAVNAEVMRKVDIDHIADELRFQSADRNRLTLVEGSVDPKQIQTIRRLTDESAELMKANWTSITSQTAIADKGDDEEEERIARLPIGELEKRQLIKARRGQGKFRQNLFGVESRCRITGITDSRFLIASHIKPWRESTNAEKLDGNNGLLLSPHVDKLFDLGLISFSDDGDILCGSLDVEEAMATWNLDTGKNVGKFNRRQKTYLAYHRSSFGFE